MKPSRQTLLVAIALTGLTLAGFFPVFYAGFISYDDPFYIINNPPVRDGLNWADVKWAFTTLYFCNWHPLTWLSHMLDAQMFGLNAAGHHATGVLVHLVNAILLFQLVRCLTGAAWRSAFVAALFAVHPLHVESVAWVSERKDVLSVFFGLLTLLAYVKYVRGAGCEVSGGGVYAARITHHRWRYYVLALVFFILGLMSKPMLVTLPCLMLLLDYWPLDRVPEIRREGSDDGAIVGDLTPDPPHPAPDPPHRALVLRRLVLEKTPFFVLAAGSCVLTLMAQFKSGSVAPVNDISLGQRVANSLVAYGWYVGKLFWPVDLAIIYPLFPTQPAGEVIVAAVLMLVLTAIACWQWRRRPYLITGWLWYVVTLVPVIGLVQVGLQAYADRYTYLPYVGLFLALAWLGAELAGDSRPWRLALGTLAVLAVGVCTVATNVQTRYWKDAATVFARAVSVTQSNYIALNNLGYALAERGEFEQAIPHYLAAIKVTPRFGDAFNNLGCAYLKQNRLDLALPAFREAAILKPNDARVRHNLATAFHESGDYTNAIAEYRESIRLDPESAEAHYNLANSLAAANEFTNALVSYERAIELRPDYTAAHLNLGYQLLRLGRSVEARTSFERALQNRTDLADAHYGLAMVAEAEHDPVAEADQLRAFLADKPDHAPARIRLATTLGAQGRTDEAMTEAQEAIRRHPDDATAQYALAVLLEQKRRPAEAIQAYEIALGLKPDYPEVLNNLAWLLATSPDAQHRNGQRAVELSSHVCELTQNKVPLFVGTLAAAYAEAGRFAEAVRTGEQAAQIAEAAGDTALATRNRELIALYRAGKTFRQQP